MIKIHPNPFVDLATTDDINRILQLWKTEMEYLHTLDPKFFSPTDSDKEEYEFRLTSAFDMFPIFILRISGKIEGFVNIYDCDNGIIDCNMIPYCEIENLIVSRKTSASGRKRLLHELKKWAKKEGYQRIDFKVHSKDEKVVEYYKMIGIDFTYHTMGLKVI